MFGWILRKIKSVYHYFAYVRPAKHIVNEIFKEDLTAVYDNKEDFKAFTMPPRCRIPNKGIDSELEHLKFTLRKKRPNMEDVQWTPLEEHQSDEYSGEQRVNSWGRTIELTTGDKMNYDAYGDDKPKADGPVKGKKKKIIKNANGEKIIKEITWQEPKPKASKKTTKKSKKKGKK